tara:strand:- start:743 stop:871 length:129 start_codon:yes stop_codon:yes gene_type:complete
MREKIKKWFEGNDEHLQPFTGKVRKSKIKPIKKKGRRYFFYK